MGRYLLLGLLSIFLCACATKDTPIIERHIIVSGEKKNTKFLGVIATTAQRRVIVVNHDGKFCAEPSPDAVDDLLSQVTASLEASLEGSGEEKARLVAEAARTIMTDAQFLIERTQGLQLFRDGSFALCAMNANGDLAQEEYLARQERLLTEAANLISLELNLLAENKGAYLDEKKNKQDFEARIEELKKLKKAVEDTVIQPPK